MVVLAASILEKGREGNVLLSRQFVPLTRARIEGLLQAFPKLVRPHSQHTFIETDHVRYVYQNVEDVYVLLVTNKQSDTIEDMETLRLLVRLLLDECPSPSPSSIRQNVFSLLFAFDEALSLGLREPITAQTVRTFLLMDSHEEKIQQIITDAKILEATRRAKEKSEEIELKKQMEREREYASMHSLASHGFGEDDMEYDPYHESSHHTRNQGTQPGSHQSPHSQSQSQSTMSGVSAVTSSTGANWGQTSDSVTSSGVKGKPVIKGMSLSSSRPRAGESSFSQIAQEEALDLQALQAQSALQAQQTLLLQQQHQQQYQQQQPQQPQHQQQSPAHQYSNQQQQQQQQQTYGQTGMHVGTPTASHQAPAQATISGLVDPYSPTATLVVVTEEKIQIRADRDGSVTSFALHGTLKVAVLDQSTPCLAIKTNGPLKEQWKIQLRPGLSRVAFNGGVIVQADAKKPFPVSGPNQLLQVCQWKGNSTGGLDAPEGLRSPLAMTCWSSEENGAHVVMVECMFQDTDENLSDEDVLQPLNTIVEIPCFAPPNVFPTVTSVDGQFNYDHAQQKLFWSPTAISRATPSACLEFSIIASPMGQNDFANIRAQFALARSFSGLKALQAIKIESKQPVEFGEETRVICEQFLLE